MKYNKNYKLITLIVTAIFIIILAIIVTDVIGKNNNKSKFLSLDTQVKSIQKQLEINGGDKWTHKAECIAKRSGSWPTGQYYCSSSISTNIDVLSFDEIKKLHYKYYSLIDSISSLKSNGELRLEPYDSFGKRFVVSSAEKRYIETKSNIECVYLFKTQNKSSNGAYGTDLIEGEGNAEINLSCSGIADDYWYTLSNLSELPNPDDPIKKP